MDCLGVVMELDLGGGGEHGGEVVFYPSDSHLQLGCWELLQLRQIQFMHARVLDLR